MCAFKQLVYITLGVIMISLFWANGPLQAQTEIDKLTERLNKQLGDIAERDKQGMFRILESFYVTSRYSVDWSDIENNLQISIPSGVLDSLDAQAHAETDDFGKHHLRINQIMLFRIYDQTQTAARYTVREAFGISLQQAQSDVTKLLGIAIEWTTKAWAIAHEISHHIYRDTQTPAKSFSEVRKRELRADIRAFELMNNASYSMVLLYRYMHFMASVEQVKKRAGQLKDDQHRTHPFWSERLQALQVFMNENVPPKNRMVIYSTLTYSSETNGVSYNMFVLPSSDIEHMGFLALVGGSFAPVGVERMNNGSVNIYIRNADVIYNFQLYDTVNFITTMKMKQNNGKELVMQAWRDSFEGAAIYDQTNQIRDTLNMDQLAIIYSEIDKMTVNNKTKQLGKSYVYQRSVRINDHMLAYYSGKISMQIAQAEIEKTTAYYNKKLLSILNENQFASLSLVLIKKMTELMQRR